MVKEIWVDEAHAKEQLTGVLGEPNSELRINFVGKESNMTIQLVKGKRQYFYRLVSTNGQVVMVSETYYSKFNARRQALKLVRANGFGYDEVVK